MAALTPKERTKLAARALVNCVQLSAEIVSIVELKLPMSVINRTETIRNMRKRIEVVTAFCDMVEKEGKL